MTPLQTAAQAALDKLNQEFEMTYPLSKADQDKAAALALISQIAAIKPVRVAFELVDELDQTERGTGGMGSTGS